MRTKNVAIHTGLISALGMHRPGVLGRYVAVVIPALVVAVSAHQQKPAALRKPYRLICARKLAILEGKGIGGGVLTEANA